MEENTTAKYPDPMVPPRSMPARSSEDSDGAKHMAPDFGFEQRESGCDQLDDG